MDCIRRPAVGYETTPARRNSDDVADSAVDNEPHGLGCYSCIHTPPFWWNACDFKIFMPRLRNWVSIPGRVLYLKSFFDLNTNPGR
ncbi:hypothetical protein Y032_0846g2658 [Ancylostoma ceylanicum]|uniref:Uncharacterized protein n=1 Tax=Ancylostoma ceylanicum TaxID=53326 RepID=A0A016WAL5_9BILA|nr:hypothetical protein Y032_0846g2658 [Ancylostoma ceylanicum]